MGNAEEQEREERFHLDLNRSFFGTGESVSRIEGLKPFVAFLGFLEGLDWECACLETGETAHTALIV